MTAHYLIDRNLLARFEAETDPAEKTRLGLLVAQSITPVPDGSVAESVGDAKMLERRVAEHLRKNGWGFEGGRLTKLGS